MSSLLGTLDLHRPFCMPNECEGTELAAAEILEDFVCCTDIKSTSA